MRALCRARKDLVETRVAVLNHLRCNLEVALPGAIGLFSKPDSPITPSTVPASVLAASGWTRRLSGAAWGAFAGRVVFR